MAFDDREMYLSLFLGSVWRTKTMRLYHLLEIRLVEDSNL
jgi:hypothetical protein